jgi:hypothetical protein
VILQGILDKADAGATPEDIAGPDNYPSISVDVVRRILRFARLAEAASLLERAETIMHRL